MNESGAQPEISMQYIPLRGRLKQQVLEIHPKVKGLILLEKPRSADLSKFFVFLIAQAAEHRQGGKVNGESGIVSEGSITVTRRSRAYWNKGGMSFFVRSGSRLGGTSGKQDQLF
jgi:hypothetical protein